MSWINLLLKGKKVAGKALKIAKSDAPFYGVAGTVLGGRHVYSKIKKRPTDIDVIKEVIKKVKDKKKDKK